MVNSQIIDRIADTLKLDLRVDTIPSPVPVIEVGTRTCKGYSLSYSPLTTGAVSWSASTIGNDSGKVFLTSCSLSVMKDATCDMATGVLTVTVSLADTGLARGVVSIPVLTLTAQNNQVYIIFQNALELLKDSQITLSGTYTAGVCVRNMTCTFYKEFIV